MNMSIKMNTLIFCLCTEWIMNSAWCKYRFHIATIERGENSSGFSIPRSGAAIDMALEYIRDKYNDTLDIQHTVRFARGGPTEVGAVLADLYCTTDIDAFIGPGSSTSVEVMGYTVTQWNLPFITPAGGSGVLGDRELYPTLIRMSPISFETYGTFLMNLLDLYSWKHFVVFHDKNSLSNLHWGSLSDQLSMETRFTWTHYEMNYKTFTEDDYERVLTTANKYARVFIIYTESSTEARRIMLIAHRLGYITGEHVMLMIIRLETSVDESYWKIGDDSDDLAKIALQSALFFTMASPYSGDYAAFEKEVKERSLRDYNFDYGDRGISFIVPSYYDSFTMYAQILNETISDGGDPRNGTAFVQRVVNRTYPGIFDDFKINEHGRRDTVLSLHDLDPVTGAFKIVGNYFGDGNKYIPVSDVSIHWPGSSGPPLDVPVCGFRNDRCQFTVSGLSDSVVISLSLCFAVLVLVSSFIAAIVIRRWKLKSEAEMWWWKIDVKDLTFTDSNKTGSGFISCTSRISILTGKDEMAVMDHMSETAIYKGIMVHLRKLPLKEQIDNKSLLMEFKQIRDMNQGNLVRVIGACLDASPKYLVTEFCSKGTLQDLLGSSRLDMDTSFKFSLCIDIAQGMCYLHDSHIQVHGRLTSATCLIDNRFSVKLADVGLSSLYNNLNVDTQSQEHKKDCLWKAPEILRDNLRHGTQTGDVYSFGIILQEVVSREAPFFAETDTFDVDEIISKVKRGSIPPFRPKLDVPVKLQDLKTLMEYCWCEDPGRRPNFHTIRKMLKSLATRFGASGNLLDNLLRRMEQYANNLEKLVDEKTTELKEEKKKSEELLYQILPRSVAENLRQGLCVDPEAFGCVTIYFSDICGFTTISARSTPFEVVDLLNDLYTCFDAVIDIFDVYKVETIGDAYMVVSGLPQRNGNRHASEISRMSLALLQAIDTFQIRHLPEERLLLRIGLHSGPVVAGVVGQKMPRYCLFGDTVNTASRMESHGQELKIHISGETAKLLDDFNTFDIQPRGLTEIKGKGPMETYWLVGEKI